MKKFYNLRAWYQMGLSLLHANNIGADQPVHPRSMISAFVILYLESTSSMQNFNILARLCD